MKNQETPETPLLGASPSGGNESPPASPVGGAVDPSTATESTVKEPSGEAEAAPKRIEKSMTKRTDHFLRASEIMMKAIDAAEGMPSRHLECFQHNFGQLTAQMIEEAKRREFKESAEERYPMGRRDRRKCSCPPGSFDQRSDEQGTMPKSASS